MKKTIVVIGSSNTDMTVQLTRLPKPGETIVGGQFFTSAGGKGANQAVAAARSGGNVTFVSCVGDDVFGRELIESYRREKINIDCVFTDRSEPTGVALIFVSENGENSIGVAPGANAKLLPRYVAKITPAIVAGGMLMLQLETPLEMVREVIRIAFDRRVPVVLNPAPAQPLDDEILKKTAYLTPNETETEKLTGVSVGDIPSAEKAGRQLLSRGVGTVILTLGERGAYVLSKDWAALVPPYRVTAVDTTAAGDVFNGAFAVALSEEKELIDAVKFANAAAALSVTRKGAQPSIPVREEIERFLKNNAVPS